MKYISAETELNLLWNTGYNQQHLKKKSKFTYKSVGIDSEKNENGLKK